MRMVERMLLELNSVYDADAWHGTPIRRLLDGIDEQRAHARPLPNAKSIAELLAHLTAWVEIVQRRLAGETFEVTEEMDFPSATDVKWEDQVERLERAHRLLVDTVARMKDSDFDQLVPGKKHTNHVMLQGLIHHSVYHSGQIALLKK